MGIEGTHPTIEESENSSVLRLDGITHKVVHAVGKEVDFGDLLIYFELHGVPFEEAKESIWANILNGNLELTGGSGVISIQEPEGVDLAT